MVTEPAPASRPCPSSSAPGLAACGELSSVPACAAGCTVTLVAVGVVETVPAEQPGPWIPLEGLPTVPGFRLAAAAALSPGGSCTWAEKPTLKWHRVGACLPVSGAL